MATGRLPEQQRDVGRHAEGFERLVNSHRVGAGGDRERPDPVGLLERRGHRGETCDFGAAASDEEHVVVVVLNREQAHVRVKFGHVRSSDGRGSWPCGAPPV